MITGFQGILNPNRPMAIANGVQSSAAIATGGLSLCGVKLPAALTGTSITFEMSETIDGTYVPVYNSAGAVTYTVAVNRYVSINPNDFQGIAFLKIKSSAVELGARTLICSMKGI